MADNRAIALETQADPNACETLMLHGKMVIQTVKSRTGFKRCPVTRMDVLTVLQGNVNERHTSCNTKRFRAYMYLQLVRTAAGPILKPHTSVTGYEEYEYVDLTTREPRRSVYINTYIV